MPRGRIGRDRSTSNRPITRSLGLDRKELDVTTLLTFCGLCLGGMVLIGLALHWALEKMG